MARIPKKHKERVDKILNEQNLFKILNDHLKDIGLADFELDSFKLKHTETEIKCEPGFKKIRICNNGVCWYDCVPE